MKTIPEWQIEPNEYLKRLNIDLEYFERQLNLPNVKNITKVLPLRNIKEIRSLIPISSNMLLYLIRRIKTLDNRKPFKNIKMKMLKMDPHHLKIGQKFVYRENYQNLLELVPSIFTNFLITSGGLSDLGAYFVFGLSGKRDYSLACYIPPIIEKHSSDLVIMDGIHRNYIAKQAGVSINAILIENVSLPFPCAAEDWSKIKVVSLKEKPKDINKRYFALKKGLFRDLKYLGIDG